MIKQLFKTGVIAMILSMPATAFAGFVVDTIVETPPIKLTAGDYVTRTHSIGAFNPSTLTSDVWLTLFVRDDTLLPGVDCGLTFLCDPEESFQAQSVLLGGFFQPTIGSGDVDNSILDFPSFEIGFGTGAITLFLTGNYTYKLTATQGDFWFGGSKLEVPEPGHLGLLLLGLAGLGIARRKSVKRAN